MNGRQRCMWGERMHAMHRQNGKQRIQRNPFACMCSVRTDSFAAAAAVGDGQQVNRSESKKDGKVENRNEWQTRINRKSWICISNGWIMCRAQEPYFGAALRLHVCLIHTLHMTPARQPTTVRILPWLYSWWHRRIHQMARHSLPNSGFYG